MSDPEGLADTERELQTLRQRIRSLEAEASRLRLAPMMTRQFTGEIRFWSDGMEQLYGYTQDEALGRVSHQLLRTEFPGSLGELEDELSQSCEWTGELRHRHRDGHELIVLSHQSLLRDPGEDVPLVTEVNTDVTGVRQGQEARQYLASIVDSSRDAIVGKTLDGVVISWNRAAEELFGYTAAEIIGHPITLLLPPDRQHEEAMILDRLRRGELLRHYETVRIGKDGTEHTVSLTVSPIFDRRGAMIGASKILRDTSTERRSQARIQELQAELAHVGRLSTMGQMASAIAHELNQPLTAVSNYAGALSRMLSGTGVDVDRAREIVDRIRQQTSRAGEVIRRLREHVAKRSTARQLESVNRVVREAVELGLVGTRHHGLRTAFALDDMVEPARIDRIQIGQVIINLVRNAVEAMEVSDIRALTVTTRALPGAVEIAVADSGPGIAPEVADNLFQPFITSKATGLGLGLSICRELVEAHGGTLSVRSTPGSGTVFVINLPTVAE